MIEFTEIRPGGAKPKPRAPRKVKPKKVVPVLVQGLEPKLFNLLVVSSAEIVTQRGIAKCLLPNCGYPTRCLLSTTGMMICAECSRLIRLGFSTKGWWVPVKRTVAAVGKTPHHIRLIGGPLDMTNVRCATGKGHHVHRWNNGFIIGGTCDELYVYDETTHTYRWWDRS